MLEFQEFVGDRGDASRVEYFVKSLPKSDKERLLAGQISLTELTADLLQHQASGVAGG